MRNHLLLMGSGGISKQYQPSKAIGYFHVIKNIREVDEEAAEPKVKPISIQQTELEGVRLTDIKTVREDHGL